VAGSGMEGTVNTELELEPCESRGPELSLTVVFTTGWPVAHCRGSES
jgi:hypothetical protein